jgi:hypothetical protein
MKSDIAGCHLVIVGHSLADPDIKAIVDRALQLNLRSGSGGQITIFAYTRDDGRASLFESRGLTVCFGGLDTLFAELTSRIVHTPATAPPTGDPLDSHPALRPTTIDASHHTVESFIGVGDPDFFLAPFGWDKSIDYEKLEERLDQVSLHHGDELVKHYIRGAYFRYCDTRGIIPFQVPDSSQ